MLAHFEINVRMILRGCFANAFKGFRADPNFSYALVVAELRTGLRSGYVNGPNARSATRDAQSYWLGDVDIEGWCFLQPPQPL